MTPLPSAAPTPLPANVASLTEPPISAVSWYVWYVWALAGSATAPTTRALPSSAGQATPSAPLRLKRTLSRPSVFVRYGQEQPRWRTPASQEQHPYHDSPALLCIYGANGAPKLSGIAEPH